MAKVICDANIWYNLGNGRLNKADYADHQLILTIVSILEAGTSYNLLELIAEVRHAIRAMIRMNDGIIEESPFIYLSHLSGCMIKYNARETFGSILQGTQDIANGAGILHEHRDDFRQWLDNAEQPFIDFADFTNQQLSIIWSKIKDRKAHKKEETTAGNRALISDWTSRATGGECNLDNLDWSKVELFEKTMTTFFTELEIVRDMKFQPNDFFDLMNLVYVQPGDKYYTLEKRWLILIRKAGMEMYLL